MDRKLKDSLSSGDIYNDGTYEGKVVETNEDSIIVETQDENGNVVNVTIPVEDDKKFVRDYFSADLVSDIIGAASNYENPVLSTFNKKDNSVGIKLKREPTQDEVESLLEYGIKLGKDVIDPDSWYTATVVLKDKSSCVSDAVDFIDEKNLNELWDQGFTEINVSKGVDPDDLVSELEDLYSVAEAPGVEIPELTWEPSVWNESNEIETIIIKFK